MSNAAPQTPAGNAPVAFFSARAAPKDDAVRAERDIIWELILGNGDEHDEVGRARGVRVEQVRADCWLEVVRALPKSLQGKRDDGT